MCGIGEVVKHISGRRSYKKRGAVCHFIYDPPRNRNLGNKCKGELYQRDDDAGATVRVRLEIYAAATSLLLEYYARLELLVEVNGIGRPEETEQRILDALEGWSSLQMTPGGGCRHMGHGQCISIRWHRELRAASQSLPLRDQQRAHEQQRCYRHHCWTQWQSAPGGDGDSTNHGACTGDGGNSNEKDQAVS